MLAHSGCCRMQGAILISVIIISVLLVRSLRTGQGAATGPEALASWPVSHRDVIIAAPIPPSQRMSSLSRCLWPPDAAMNPLGKSKRWGWSLERPSEGRQGLGPAPSNLQCELELVSSCPGSQFPQLYGEGVGPDILHALEGAFLCVILLVTV